MIFCLIINKSNFKWALFKDKSIYSCIHSIVQSHGSVPPIEVLIEQYGTPWDVAFFISRQMYNHQIQNKYESNIQEQNAETENAKAEIFIDCADNILLPIAKTVESMHTENVWQDINPNFYTAFWTMTMYDISTPTSSYKKEIKKIKEQIDQLDNNSELNSGHFS